MYFNIRLFFGIISVTICSILSSEAIAATERVIQSAGVWHDVLLDEKNLAMSTNQDGVTIRFAPDQSGQHLGVEVFLPDAPQNALLRFDDYSISLEFVAKTQSGVILGAKIEPDATRNFIHAFTSGKAASIVVGDTQKSISLSGTSAAVSGLIFYAHEHNLPLPAPFGATVQDDADGKEHASAIYSSGPPEKRDSSSAVGGVCAQDWHACRDNTDFVNNYTKIYEAQAACKLSAEEGARFGTPQWPGFWSGGAFGSFKTGDDAPKTGIVTLIENNAQFQNGYGAMVHSTVVCQYDYNKKKTQNIEVIAH